MRNSGTEMARLLLRGVLGTTMAAHGVKHARSLDGTAGWFGSIGFSYPKAQAAASAASEIAAGAALIAGAATPVAASAVVGTLGVAAGSVHRPNGFFITSEGYEYVLALSTAAVALAALGPGRWSVDARLGLDDRLSGPAVGLATVAAGAAAAAAHLRVFWTKPQS